MSTKDPLDFGVPTPKRDTKFKLPDPLPTSRPSLLALVAARGGFNPRAARWLAPRELKLLLTGDFPFESSAIYAVREPRQIKNEDELLTLCAERRSNYYAEQKAKKGEAKPKPTPKKRTPRKKATEPTNGTKPNEPAASEPTKPEASEAVAVPA